MAIQSIQANIDTTKPVLNEKKKGYKSYMDVTKPVDTEGLVKPLPPKGHLVRDSFGNGIKFFFKDIAYDIKAVKNGIKGVPNDHQAGRLNDVGLKLGGIGIAAYLASKTNDPKTRLMEYVGLGVFLASMSIFPKIAINAPAKFVHGYDIDKQFIDDQGRKKSVFQDSNYIPYDMYMADVKEEDLDIIGDKLGVPRDIKNRHDLVKEQMRKIATQNNTLWMLTAGFATPVMTALICRGCEDVATYAISNIRNNKVDKAVAEVLKNTTEMSGSAEKVQASKLGKEVGEILAKYEGKALPEAEYKKILTMLTENIDNNLSIGVKKDITNLLKDGASLDAESVFFDKSLLDRLSQIAEGSVKLRSADKTQELREILVPSSEELEAVIKSVTGDVSLEQGTFAKKARIPELREKLTEVIEARIKNSSSSTFTEEMLAGKKFNVVDSIIEALEKEKALEVTKSKTEKIVKFADVLSDFSAHSEAIRKCQHYKVEYAPETVIARSYSKFERAFFGGLDIKLSDMKKMQESESYTKEILEKKFSELAKDEAKYSKFVEKLGKIMSEMDVELNGNGNKTHLKDIYTATENVYNKTAQRLFNSFDGAFENTIRDLVYDNNPNELKPSLNTLEDLFRVLDGTAARKGADLANKELLEVNVSGVGSSKNKALSRLVERYSGAKNSFNRILHTLDVYKRGMNPSTFTDGYGERFTTEYVDDLIRAGKDTLLSATSSQHNLKLNTTNNPNYYQDLMRAVWRVEPGEITVTSKGTLSSATEKALKPYEKLANGSVGERLQHYIARFRTMLGNSEVDAMKPKHRLGGTVDIYSNEAKTRLSTFNLVSQSPVEFAKDSARRIYENKAWLRTAGIITGVVFGVTVATQFLFGKIKNPQNVKKQEAVNDTVK